MKTTSLYAFVLGLKVFRSNQLRIQKITFYLLRVSAKMFCLCEIKHKSFWNCIQTIPFCEFYQINPTVWKRYQRGHQIKWQMIRNPFKNQSCFFDLYTRWNHYHSYLKLWKNNPFCHSQNSKFSVILPSKNTKKQQKCATPAVNPVAIPATHVATRWDHVQQLLLVLYHVHLFVSQYVPNRWCVYKYSVLYDLVYLVVHLVVHHVEIVEDVVRWRLLSRWVSWVLTILWYRKCSKIFSRTCENYDINKLWKFDQGLLIMSLRQY